MQDIGTTGTICLYRSPINTPAPLIRLPTSPINIPLPIAAPVVKNKGGRPCKYTTDEERKEAKKAAAARYHNKPSDQIIADLRKKIEDIEQDNIVLTRRVDRLYDLLKDQQIVIQQLLQ